MHCPCPEDGQDHPCLTQMGVLQKKGSMELQQSLVPHRHQPAPRAEPPGTRSMVKQREELYQAAGWGHAAQVGEGSQLKKEIVNYTNAQQLKKGCPAGCETIVALSDLLQNQMLQLKGPGCPALFSSELQYIVPSSFLVGLGHFLFCFWIFWFLFFFPNP